VVDSPFFLLNAEFAFTPAVLIQGGAKQSIVVKSEGSSLITNYQTVKLTCTLTGVTPYTFTTDCMFYSAKLDTLVFEWPANSVLLKEGEYSLTVKATDSLQESQITTNLPVLMPPRISNVFPSHVQVSTPTDI